MDINKDHLISIISYSFLILLARGNSWSMLVGGGP